jgi:hypothetical protein
MGARLTTGWAPLEYALRAWRLTDPSLMVALQVVTGPFILQGSSYHARRLVSLLRRSASSFLHSKTGHQEDLSPNKNERQASQLLEERGSQSSALGPRTEVPPAVRDDASPIYVNRRRFKNHRLPFRWGTLSAERDDEIGVRQPCQKQ